MLVSEPTPKKETSEVQVFHYKKKVAAVWVRRGVTVERVDTDCVPGLALVRVAWRLTFVVHRHHFPNAPREQHERQLAELVEIVEEWSPMVANADVVVAGDFTAKTAMWRSLVEDERGRRLGEAVIGLGLVTCNVGSVPTCVRGGSRWLINVTFATSAFFRRIMNWKVEDEAGRGGFIPAHLRNVIKDYLRERG